jgi:hypothetical protein
MNEASAKVRPTTKEAGFRSIVGALHNAAIVKFYQQQLAHNCGYTQIVITHRAD